MGRKASSLGRTRCLVEMEAVRPLLVTVKPQKSSDLESCVRTGLCWGLPPPASGVGAGTRSRACPAPNLSGGGLCSAPPRAPPCPLTALHLEEHPAFFSGFLQTFIELGDGSSISPSWVAGEMQPKGSVCCSWWEQGRAPHGCSAQRLDQW